MTSRVLTPRVLALAAAAALAGTPILIGSPANAGEAVMPTASVRSDATGTVTFNGGCGLLGSGLGGTSTPDATQVSVPAGSGLRFANRLGQPATLLLNGESAGQVPTGGVADVVFQNGPVAASMQVACMLGSPAGTVTVEVTRTDPEPAEPSAPSSPSSPSSPERPGTRPASGGGTTDRGGSKADPGGAPEGVWWPAVPAQPPVNRPDDGQARDDRDRPGRDGNRRGRWAIEVEPADGGGLSGEPATVETESVEGELAAQPMSRTAGSTSDDGPIGLLALIATVCVVGVSAGAIRALVTQRANRAEWA